MSTIWWLHAPEIKFYRSWFVARKSFTSRSSLSEFLILLITRVNMIFETGKFLIICPLSSLNCNFSTMPSRARESATVEVRRMKGCSLGSTAQGASSHWSNVMKFKITTLSSIGSCSKKYRWEPGTARKNESPPAQSPHRV